jgi:hypothetical protein
MKKNLSVVTAVLVGLAISSSTIAWREAKTKEPSVFVQATPLVAQYSSKITGEAALAVVPVVNTAEEIPAAAQFTAKSSISNQLTVESQKKQEVPAVKEDSSEEKKPVESKKSTEEINQTTVAVSVKPKSKIVSRGGTPPKAPSSIKKNRQFF